MEESNSKPPFLDELILCPLYEIFGHFSLSFLVVFLDEASTRHALLCRRVLFDAEQVKSVMCDLSQKS